MQLGRRLPLAWIASLSLATCVERGDVLNAEPPVANAGMGALAGTSGSAGDGVGGSGTAGDGAGGAPPDASGGVSATAGSDAGELRASQVKIAESHACAIVAGVAQCWGNNERGQLGLGDQTARLVPTPLPGAQVWRHLTLGVGHSCGLDDVGRVYCWGENTRGELGQGDRDDRSSPSLVDLAGRRATALSSDFEHTCAVLTDFTLECWGKNDEGDLGQDDDFPGMGSPDADALSPVPLPGSDWQSVDTGQGHTCAIALDGALFCWGRNSNFELGAGSSAAQLRTPTRIGSDNDWLEVDAGQQHTCAKKRDLSIWCWGMNTGFASEGGYPLGIEGAERLAEPTRVGSASDWTLFRTNTFHTCALKQNSELWCWGRNAEGQLGLGDVEARPVPVLVGSDYADVSAGRFSTCALTSDGQVRCAGENRDGQLGTRDTERRDTLSDVSFDTP